MDSLDEWVWAVWVGEQTERRQWICEENIFTVGWKLRELRYESKDDYEFSSGYRDYVTTMTRWATINLVNICGSISKCWTGWGRRNRGVFIQEFSNTYVVSRLVGGCIDSRRLCEVQKYGGLRVDRVGVCECMSCSGLAERDLFSDSSNLEQICVFVRTWGSFMYGKKTVIDR